jgi:hypothetical protein
MRSQKDPVQGLSSQRCEDITHEHSFEDWQSNMKNEKKIAKSKKAISPL